MWEIGIYIAAKSQHETTVWHQREESLLFPVILGGSLLLAIAFTIGCGMLFLYDAYYVFIESESIRSMVSVAAEYSLDDILSIVCDPTQLAMWLSAIVLIPTTIYTLPTAASERSRVLRSSGFLPTDGGDEILLEPGAWKALLPRRLQTTISEILHTQKESAPEMVEVSMERMSEDGDEPDYCPYSISPIYHAKKQPEDATIDTTSQTIVPEDAVLSSVEVELYQVFSTAVRKILNETLAHINQESQKLPLLLVAASSLGIFAVHQRHSAKARSLLKTLIELGVMAGTSSTAVASLLGLVGPMLYRDAPQEQSLLQKMCGFASGIGLIRWTIPSSVADVKRIPWRGTIAALVLFYFRQRYAASRKRHERYAAPRGFS